MHEKYIFIKNYFSLQSYCSWTNLIWPQRKLSIYRTLSCCQNHWWTYQCTSTNVAFPHALCLHRNLFTEIRIICILQIKSRRKLKKSHKPFPWILPTPLSGHQQFVVSHHRMVHFGWYLHICNRCERDKLQRVRLNIRYRIIFFILLLTKLNELNYLSKRLNKNKNAEFCPSFNFQRHDTSDGQLSFFVGCRTKFRLTLSEIGQIQSIQELSVEVRAWGLCNK